MKSIILRSVQEGSVYSQGCSEFVCKVVGSNSQSINSILGTPIYVGENNLYFGLLPGDVVGWKDPFGIGHVAIYVGESNIKFIDVPGPGKRPRIIKNGYGLKKLYKSSRY